jgi:hypothetical protein
MAETAVAEDDGIAEDRQQPLAAAFVDGALVDVVEAAVVGDRDEAVTKARRLRPQFDIAGGDPVGNEVPQP